MQQLYLDTNIIIDFLGERQPFVKAASVLFAEAHRHSLKLFCSPGSITTSYYLLEKNNGAKAAREKIRILLKYIDVVPTNKKTIEQAAESAFHDFEDAVEYFTARSHSGTDFIITRNVRDFSKSSIPVLTAEEFVLTEL